MLIWFTPTNCGDSPEKSTRAPTPPTNTVGVVTVVRSASTVFAPFGTAGLTAPNPVARMITVSPARAGCVARPGIAPAGAARLPSILIAIACPTPNCVEKIPGEYGPTCSVCGGDATPFRDTT